MWLQLIYVFGYRMIETEIYGCNCKWLKYSNGNQSVIK